MFFQDFPPPSKIENHIFCNKLATVIRIIPKTEEELSKGHQDIPYENLPGAEKKEKVINLIETLANHGYKSLFAQRKKIYKEGDDIKDVHPLKFLVYITSTKEMKNNVKKILDKSLKNKIKRESFLKNLIHNLNVENNRKSDEKNYLLKHYLKDFAKETNHTEDQLRHFFESAKWESLLKFLIEN